MSPAAAHLPDLPALEPPKTDPIAGSDAPLAEPLLGEALTAHFMFEPSDAALLADHEMRKGL